MANKKKSDFKFMKGAAATSIKSIKYSATELTIDRVGVRVWEKNVRNECSHFRSGFWQ